MYVVPRRCKPVSAKYLARICCLSLMYENKVLRYSLSVSNSWEIAFQ